jgi:hypothetical protein
MKISKDARIAQTNSGEWQMVLSQSFGHGRPKIGLYMTGSD